MNERFYTEKTLKRYIKMKKIGFSLSLVVQFLITGFIANATDTPLEIEKNKLITQIKDNKEKIYNIEQKMRDLEKSIEIYEKSLDSKEQFFFPVTFEHRHSKKIAKSSSSTSENLPAPDKIEIDIPNDLPKLDEITIDTTISGTDSELVEKNITANTPNYSRVDIKEKKLKLNETPLTHDEPNIKPTDIITKIDTSIPNVSTTDVNVPTELDKIIKFYNPDILKNPETFKVTKVTAPQTGELKPIEIDIIGFGQGVGGFNSEKFGETNQVIVENYNFYNTKDNVENVGITFSDLNIGYSVNSQEATPLDFMKNMFAGYITNNTSVDAFLMYNGAQLRDKFFEVQNNDYGAKEGAFISDTKSSNTSIDGKYNINYKDGSDRRVGDIRYFYSFNPAGVGNRRYDVNGDLGTSSPNGNPTSDVYNNKVGDFTGTLNLNNTSTGNYLVGLDNQIWDQKLKEYENTEITDDYKKTYTILKNSGTINITADGKNTIGISISVERGGHSQDKLVNHKTINKGIIDIAGNNSIAISFEGKASSDKGYLRHDLYSGIIGLLGNNNYGIRVKNFTSSNSNNKNYYDYSRIYGTNTAILEKTGLKKSTSSNELEKDEIDLAPSKIEIIGKNNVGIIISQGLSQDAKLYQKGGKYYVEEDLIDLGDEKTAVNPIANIKGLNIYVAGNGNIGFLRAKDYSDNNTADMIIREDVSTTGDYGRNGLGAISKIAFMEKTSGEIGNSTLIRTDNGGITLKKNLDVNSIGGVQATVKDGKIQHNIVLQATASKEKDDSNKIVAGKITNEATITTSKLDNTTIEETRSEYSNGMIGMMANDNEVLSTPASTLEEINKVQATITNKGTIHLTGDNNIGMAVLGKNKGEIIGEDNKKAVVTVINRDTSTSTSLNYNLGVYNEGDFSISNGEINSSSGNGIGIYNTNGNITFSKDNTIKATDGGVGIYSSGGTITQTGTLTIDSSGTSIENSGGIGIYATDKANLTFDNANITVDGNSGIVTTNGSNITINGGTITYKGKGYALYTDDNNESKITIGSTTKSDISPSLVLDGEAFGMKLNLTPNGENGYTQSSIDLNGLKEIKVKSNDVVVFNLVGSKDNKVDFNLNTMITQLSGALGKITNNDKILSLIKRESDDIDNFKIVSIDGGNLTINQSIAQSDTDNFEGSSADSKDISNLGFLYFKRFLGQRMNITVGNNGENIVVNSTMSNQHAKKYFDGEVVGLEANSSNNATSNEETSITLEKGAQVIANRLDNTSEKSDENKATIGIFTNYGKVTLEGGSKVVVEGSVDKEGNIVASATDEELKKWNSLDDKTYTDKIIDGGIGIYATNGTVVDTNAGSNITAFGNKSIGIYGTAYRKSENGDTHKNEFTNAGQQGTLVINHSGVIDVSKTSDDSKNLVSSKGSIGIYAENNNEPTNQEHVKVNNSGDIIVGDENSAGIFIVGGTLSNNGNITVGNSSVGIYANSSSIEGNNLGTITLGDNSTGIFLTKDSSLTASGLLTLKSNSQNSEAIKVGINYGQDSNTQKEATYSVDMSEVKGGNAIVTNGNALNFKGDSIKINGENSKALATKDGDLTIDKETTITLTDNGSKNIDKSSIGIFSSGEGKISNAGTIKINSDKGIGIYSKAENIKSLGKIELNSDNGVGIYLKSDTSPKSNSDLSSLLSNKNISFGENSKNSIAIYAENENIKIGELTNEGILGSNNILLVADKSNVTTNDGAQLKVTGKNTGIQLKNSATYAGNIIASNGAIGVHINDSTSSYTGEIEATEGATGIYTSADLISKNNISVTGVEDKNGIGIFTAGNNLTYSNDNTITLSNNSIGIFSYTDDENKAKDKKVVTLAGTINSSTLKSNSNSESVGIYSNYSDVKISKSGKIELEGNSNIGVYSKGGVSNDGTISINGESGVGVFLDGENAQYVGNSGTIKTSSESDNIGIAIYLQNGAKLSQNIGKIELSEKDIAIFSNGSSISGTDNDNRLKLDSSGGENSNIALTQKTGQNNIMIRAKSQEKDSELKFLDINLGKSSMGIYAEDSGVKMSNISITALEPNSSSNKNSDNSYSVGIYLEKLKNSSTPYSIDSTDIKLVKGMGIFLGAKENQANQLELKNSKVTIDSTAKTPGSENEAESAFGVYIQKNGELLSENTIYDINNGIGIYGGRDSSIKLSGGKINFTGHNIGVFSDGGDISIDKSLNFTFNKENNETGVTGSAIFSKNGNIENKANIVVTDTSLDAKDFSGIVGVFDDSCTGKSIINSGNISINGSSSIAISASGYSDGNKISNSGNLTISNTDISSDKLSIGIYSTGADIENSGEIKIGNSSIGIVYSKKLDLLSPSEVDSVITNNNQITINGKNSIGMYLEGATSAVKNSNITLDNSSSSGSIAIYTKDFSTSDFNLGNIKLAEGTTGMYISNSDFNISNGEILGAKDSTGIYIDSGSKLSIKDIKITVEDSGIGIYNSGNLELTLDNLNNIASDGTLLYSDKGSTKLDKLDLNLSNGTGIVLANNSKLEINGNKNLTVQDRGTGIALISQSENISALNGINITLKSSADTDSAQAIGIIYDKSTNFDNNYQVNLEGNNNFGVVLKDSSGKLVVNTTFNENSSNSIGVVVDNENTNPTLTTIGGNFLVDGKNNIGVSAKNATLGVNADFTVNKGTGIFTSDSALEYSGENLSVGSNSIGIYGKNSTIVNKGVINVLSDKAIGAIIEGVTGKFSNSGTINLNNGAIGIMAKDGAIAINEKDGKIVIGDKAGSSSNLGMVAIGNSTLKNFGTIDVNSGIGMYVESGSSLNNSGIINVNNGYGVGGTGNITNAGTIHITKPGEEVYIPKDENQVISIVDNIAKISSSFVNVGGNLSSDYDLELDNPTVDITAGDSLGFIAPNISGDIRIDSRFALTGNGYSFTFEDFLPDNTDIDVNTSPLFKPSVTDKDIIIVKVPYKDIAKDSQFDNLYDGLDELLEKNIDVDVLKNINTYLDSFGNGSNFDNQYRSVMNSLKGDIYSNIQSRIQDINRSFDNSFNEMENSYNLTRDTDKFSLIYTNGDYKNSNTEVPGYDYNIVGLMYMKEYDGVNLGDKYGYSFGFSGSDFKFDDTFNSKEKVYSLKTGLHNVKAFSKSLNLLTKFDVGYNYHDVDRKAFANLHNKADIHSYSVSLENRLRKSLYEDSEVKFKVYTGIDLEYGGYRDFKESGDLKLRVEDNDFFKSELKVGTNLALRHALSENYSLKIATDIAYSYDFGNNYDSNKAKLKDSTQEYYHLMSEEKTRDKMGVNLKLGIEKNDHFEVGVEGEYSKDFKRAEDYWKVGLRVTYKINN